MLSHESALRREPNGRNLLIKKLLVTKGIATRSKDATRNKCLTSSIKCLTSSNKKLLETKGIATRSKDATRGFQRPMAEMAIETRHWRLEVSAPGPRVPVVESSSVIRVLSGIL